ncbi:uncharacterized protein [Musca autumnalis]|uniref:uncharacterized protein n=1 Tax=Musca autumnalis TaxID=221902 RepID=UPI003CF0CE2D
MKHLTKQSVIIGSFALVFCLACIAIEFGDIYVKISWADEGDHHYDFMERNAFHLAVFIGGAITSLLLIWGAKKNRHWAIIPSTLCVFGAMAVTIFYVGYNLLFMPFGHFELLQMTTPILGVEVLIFHILTTTFGEIRRKRLEQETSRGPQHPNYYDKI